MSAHKLARHLQRQILVQQQESALQIGHKILLLHKQLLEKSSLLSVLALMFVQAH